MNKLSKKAESENGSVREKLMNGTKDKDVKSKRGSNSQALEY